jgi:ribonuclease-3
VQARLGHRFANATRLREALTHRSRAHEEGGPAAGNERLEFLGDAALGLVVGELLMEALPDADEGALSLARASAVNRGALARAARALELGQWLRLGRGEARSGGRDKDSILANGFEALLGALYLDGGLAAVRALVVRELAPTLELATSARRDAKTALQEALQARAQPPAEYRVLAERGPDHAREFEVEVSCGSRVLGTGVGRTKREAEQAAARQALEAVRS